MLTRLLRAGVWLAAGCLIALLLAPPARADEVPPAEERKADAAAPARGSAEGAATMAEDPGLGKAPPREIASPPDHFLVAPLEEVIEEILEPLHILDEEVLPGERVRPVLALGESFAGYAIETPIEVIRGVLPGPTLCLVAGVHGDEVVGIEIVRRVTEGLDPDTLNGTVIGVPIANPLGFRRSSRFLPDRRDLNRYFPGRPAGSLASRVAHALFDGIVRGCDVLVDFHSGSFHRTNLPQVRADLRDARLLHLASWFGPPVVLHNEGREGTLRRAANNAGVRAILFEAGEPLRFDANAVQSGLEGVARLMRALGMEEGEPLAPRETEIFRGSRWVRTDEGGIFLGDRELGDRVELGDRLGTVTDPFTHARSDVVSPESGRIIGRALDQVVLPGFALYHLATTRPDWITGAVPGEPEAAGDVGPELDERPE